MVKEDLSQSDDQSEVRLRMTSCLAAANAANEQFMTVYPYYQRPTEETTNIWRCDLRS